MENEVIIMIIVSGVIGAVITRFASLPDKINKKDDELANRINKVESELAVIRETKLTEPQVRAIMHEQLKPLLFVIDTMKAEQQKQSALLVRIDERVSALNGSYYNADDV